MEIEPSVNELLNIIEVLRNALNFYANYENYKETIVTGESMSSNIEIDKGNLATVALAHAKAAMNYKENMIDNLKKAVESMEKIKPLETNLSKETEDFLNQIKEMNNIMLNIENITNNENLKENGESNENN